MCGCVCVTVFRLLGGRASFSALTTTVFILEVGSGVDESRDCVFSWSVPDVVRLDDVFSWSYPAGYDWMMCFPGHILRGMIG